MGCKSNHVTDNDIDEDLGIGCAHLRIGCAHLRIGCAQNALALHQLNLTHEISLAIQFSFYKFNHFIYF